jgi:O-acetyl-ADP-ribose deacetylase (regulator of RNase III)
MITFTQGNLLKADVEALVNTVNTVGVMGKGIALMFKDAYPENFKTYEAACKRGELEVGRVFATRREQLDGPRWIINFPTKKHWRQPSKIEWIKEGLDDLRIFLVEHQIQSVALPPLGTGNGGLDWREVRPLIKRALGSLGNVQVIVYEPTPQYQNVAKRRGVEKLTPARALIAEAVRRYSVLGMECTLLEVQKLAYFIERALVAQRLDNPLKLEFQANRFGPYAPKLTHLLNALDGSYLHCGKRLADAGPLDTIWFEESKRDVVAAYLGTEAKKYRPALDAATNAIDGFESPLGMELLATIDWLVHRENIPATREAIKEGLRAWPGGEDAGSRKLKLFDARLIDLALKSLTSKGLIGAHQ